VALNAPVYRLAIEAADRKDEVKITAAIGKLIEEDPSLVFEQNAATQEMVLAGQGAARGEIPVGAVVIRARSDWDEPEDRIITIRPECVPLVVRALLREVGREDRVLGIVGSGIQARLTARLHALVLPLERIVMWGRTRERAEECARELADVAAVEVVDSPAAVAREARLIVTVTAARAPLLKLGDLQPGTHITAVGSDGPGKQELDPHVVRRADWILADSIAQCERLGELQHAKSETARAIELGWFCERPAPYDRSGITVADFTGLGAEDLYIAEACLRGLGA